MSGRCPKENRAVRVAAAQKKIDLYIHYFDKTNPNHLNSGGVEASGKCITHTHKSPSSFLQ